MTELTQIFKGLLIGAVVFAIPAIFIVIVLSGEYTRGGGTGLALVFVVVVRGIVAFVLASQIITTIILLWMSRYWIICGVWLSYILLIPAYYVAKYFLYRS